MAGSGLASAPRRPELVQRSKERQQGEAGMAHVGRTSTAVRVGRAMLLVVGLGLAVPGLVGLGMSLLVSVVMAITGAPDAALFFLLWFALPGAGATLVGVALVRFGAGPEDRSTDRESEGR